MSTRGERVQQDAQAAEYMVSRSLALLLTDLRRWRKDLHSVQFGLGSAPSEEALRGPILGELLTLLNVWACGRRLCEDLLDSISIPQAWTREVEIVAPESLEGPIDWPKTLEHHQKGGMGFVVQSIGRRVAEQEARFVAIVLNEFSVHCRIISQRVIDSTSQIMPGYLLEIIEEVETSRIQVDNLLHGALNSFCGDWEFLSIRVEEGLQQALQEEKPSTEIFSSYEKTVQIKTPRGTFISNVVRNIAKWREQYLACEVWLTNESAFSYTRAGDISDLYEMWCFFELTSAIRRSGVDDFFQVCFIKRRQNLPQFGLGRIAYVYFDYRSSSMKDMDEGIVLGEYGLRGAVPGVYVEWFIRNLDNFRSSICLDVKYAEWESREVLKVMGYMHNYGIEHGVLIIKDRIRQATIRGEEIVPGFYRVACPAGSTLWIISLPPSLDNEVQNSNVLDKFVELVLYPRK